MNNKRGLSPVIATILLVAIVVILGAIIFLWARSFFGERVEKFEMSEDQACEKVALKAEYTSGDLDIINEGDVALYGFKVEKIKKGESERIGKLYYLVGKEQKPTDKVQEGDIAAVAKLKNTDTSDTLCDGKNLITFESIKFPEPVISFSITPESRSDEKKISEALSKLSIEDPTFKISRDQIGRAHV